MDDPIWQPDSSRIDQANLSRFRRQIESGHNTDLADYPALYQWSLENPEAFWRAVWDDGGVIAETRGDVTLEQEELMPGARWFPQAR
ncbi:MAG: acetyl-coenzyme A synthetase N-terminal domain-containing protein, partial [Sedimenticola sp.]